MSLRELREKEWAAEGYTPSHEIGGGFTEMLSVTWRNGVRCGFPWARFTECTLEENGDLVLSFGEREIVLHGLNLAELWDHLNNHDLAKVWELPADYVPPPTLSKHRVCICKIELRESDVRGEASRDQEPHARRESQMTMARMRV
ncbi:MAG TPA: hypothetical protein VG710_02860 [Opitutus sp.]|nr:hypothetical protein [Opitutus sp.]